MSQEREHKQLSRQLVRVILSLYLGLATILTALHLILEVRNEKDILDNEVELYGAAMSPSAGEALWNFDDEQMHAVLTGIARNKDIVRASIIEVDANGQALSDPIIQISNDLKDRTSLINQGEGLPYSVLFSEAFSLFSSEKNPRLIGYLKLYYSSDTLVYRVSGSFFYVLLFAVIKTTGLFLIALVVIRKYVATPLLSLEKEVSQFDVGALSKDAIETPEDIVKHHRNNELAKVGQAIHTMKSSLVDRNLLIQKYTENLEEVVQSRTAKLEQSLKELEKMNQLKSEFLANMSHEIRTPMNGVLGMLQLLQRSELSEKQARFTSMAKSSAESLLAIINDILDFSKMEAGKLDLELSPFDVTLVFEHTIQSLSLSANKKEVALYLDLSGMHDHCVLGDAGRVRQILVNLVSNAIKFTEQGHVLVRAKNVLQGNKSIIKVDVEDTGIGIPEAYRATLFNSFTQADASTTRRYGGTGLGLSIVKQLCDLMNGTVDVQSEEDVGTCFSVTLELEHVEEASKFKEPKPISILMVGSDAIEVQILSNYCQQLTCNVKHIQDSQSALREIQGDQERFDLVIADMADPQMDGVRFYSELLERKLVESDQILLISLPNNPMLSVCEEKGIRCLERPVLMSEFLQVIDNVAKKQSISVSHSHPASDAQINSRQQ